ncbi:MAG: dihydropteroate synthase [Alphaproteobacteria bacterium]|nr:dihydropteroate synthase [Alphaproteobacteria bacterium]MDP6517939.1 dihydropteroate synthase [Alphaproteobacteria bacterium]
MTEAIDPKFIAIGENVHTTRVLLRKGKRIATEEGVEGIRYQTPDGEDRLLAIPDRAKEGQEYQEGRVKHVMVAVQAAMSGDGAAAEEGLAYLRYLVARQERAGAHYLDLNVDEISWKLADQKAAMAWLVRTVQGMTDLPVSVDSSNLEVIDAGLEVCESDGARPMLNSASLERPDGIDLAVAHGARLVVTAAGATGMPDGPDERVTNATRIVEAATAKGVATGDIFIDPLVFPISVDGAFGTHCLDAIRALRAALGTEIHITGGMSNVSFGVPGRKIINDVFLNLAVDAGADSGIIDPVAGAPADILAVDSAHPSFKLAEDALMGRDEHCRAYIRAWRKGELAPLNP